MLPNRIDTAIKISSSVGTVIGQIGFGVLNDILGRKKVMIDAMNRWANSRCTGLN
jgi:hypothetical protein